MIQPTYLIVEKLVNYSNLATSKHYVDQYQTCRVHKSHQDSGLNIGEVIFVGNNIFFDSAKEVGENLFFIFLEEVYGVVRNDIIVPMNDFVYIQTDKDRKKTIKGESGEYFNDTTYNTHHKDNIVQDGFIFSVCTSAKDSYFGNKLKIEVESGDHVYTHHFLTDSDNEREFNGKNYYEIKYENLYCKVKDSNITMLNDWNFISPIPDTLVESETGFVLDFVQKYKLRVGTVSHLCKSLSDKGLKKGDKIFFKHGREYEIIIEGNTFYRINTNDIIYKLY